MVAADSLSLRLLAWYDRHRRLLPWRAPPGEAPDPYRVWLSEIMLQQTTVATVIPHYGAFVARWPTVAALAAAGLDEVLHAWQGLGYYARARNLHACARVVALERGGRFPRSEEELARLPGIGEYTAAAVAAIAFGRPAAAVDGNVVRVIARLGAIDRPLPGARGAIAARTRALVPAERPGDFAQALMDLGATVCTPAAPACGACPWQDACAARRLGRPEAFPVRPARSERPTRRGIAFWTVREDGAVLLRRRPEKGLLGGLMEVPSTPWRTAAWRLEEAAAAAPVAAPWRLLPGVVRHTFTHFHLELRVAAARVVGAPAGAWCRPDDMGAHALPTLMRKVVRHALGGAAATDRRPSATRRGRRGGSGR